MTTVQLERLELMRAADTLRLPRVDLDVRTQSDQASSLTGVTFVAADERWLRQPPRELLHHSLLAETHVRLIGESALPVPHPSFEYLDLRGRSGVWPDAQFRLPAGGGHDWSVEVDTGYSPKRRDQKLIAAAQDGYGTLVWATSVHGRVEKVARRIRELHRARELRQVQQAIVLYVNVHTADRDPYAPRRRLNKSSLIHIDLAGSADE
ncbi:hypothetical protein [Deinococcus indicus]|uniref:hypothetical protein n=1 Tax=Deinococcus indicus TaxID=223556 RepID=UPI0011777609|nr:hypothetical protein [Deinococcus indicus]